MDENLQPRRHLLLKAAMRIYGRAMAWLDALGAIGQRNILEQYRRLDEAALEEAEDEARFGERPSDW